jgi:sugar/nucleoside kinase (ribokinase family)
MAVGIVGNTTCDLVDELPARAGGAALYGARALARLGHPGVVVTRTAAEDAGLVDEVRACGLPVCWRPGGATATFRLEYGTDGRAVSILRLGDPWSLADAQGWVSDALAGVSWVHVGALCRADFPPATLVELARGRRLALDAQGLLRPGRTGRVVLADRLDPSALAKVSVLKLAEDEAQAVGILPDAPSLSALGVPEVVLTRGALGALVVWAGGSARIRTVEVRGADATGAGDMFLAAYVGRRDAGDGPEEAASAAAGVAGDLLAARRAS